RKNVTMAANVIWEAVHGPIPEGKEVDHICHNPLCRNIEHYRLLTRLGNQRTKKNTKLNMVIAREIRSKLGTVTKTQLARDYGVSFMTITFIERNKIWKETENA